MNKVTIFGNITNDITTTNTQSGKTVAKFTIAVNNGKDADGKERPADLSTVLRGTRRLKQLASSAVRVLRFLLRASLRQTCTRIRSTLM